MASFNVMQRALATAGNPRNLFGGFPGSTIDMHWNDLAITLPALGNLLALESQSLQSKCRPRHRFSGWKLCNSPQACQLPLT
jgi:hypothetical protein